MRRPRWSGLTKLLGGMVSSCLLVACGGSTAPPSRSLALHYVNSPTATDTTWRLEYDASASDPSKVVLKVLGPAGLRTKGATIFLTCGTDKVAWATPIGGSTGYAVSGKALDLSLGPDPAVQMFKSKVSPSGSDLQVGAYQKQGMATFGSEPLFSVALSLRSGAQPGPVVLLNTASKTSVYLDDQGTQQPLRLAIGTLEAD
jgi:hypothetical protein